MNKNKIFLYSIGNQSIHTASNSHHGQDDSSSTRELVSFIPECQIEWSSLEKRFRSTNKHSKASNILPLGCFTQANAFVSKDKNLMQEKYSHCGECTPAYHCYSKLNLWLNLSNENLTWQLTDNIPNVEKSDTITQLLTGNLQIF
jgi:hypothetical protein